MNSPATTSSPSYGFIQPCRRCFTASASTRNANRHGMPPSDAISWRMRRKNAAWCRWMLEAVDSRLLHNGLSSSAGTSPVPTVEIPVSCYQLIGVSDRAEKDEIVKKVMQLKRLEIDEGYTSEATMYRQDLLMDIRDKLLFEPEFAGNMKEKMPPKSSLRIPLVWLPGVLCLLQEVGEDKLVMQIGQAALQLPDIKPFVHDVLLSMAHAECAIAKSGFEKNKVALGFEALARAQSLLKSKSSLEKLALLAEIEDSLEELAPACTLDILSLPRTPENSERRQGAIAALKELLRQGFEAEASSKIPDWSSFLAQAFEKLMAREIIELLPWVELAAVRKNKKSLESQNQKAVIDYHCFYLVLIAHIAVGFSNKQIETINRAKIVCECLMASEGVDLKLEEAISLFLLGQGDENAAVDRLRQLLASTANSGAQKLLRGKEMEDSSGERASLERWLRDNVLAVFPDTRDSPSSIAGFFHGDKKHIGKRKITASPPMNQSPHWSSLNSALKRMNVGESLPSSSSSQHTQSAVERLVPPDPQSESTSEQNQSNPSEPSTQLKRSFVPQNEKGWENLFAKATVIGKISAAAVVGCLGIIALKLCATRLTTVTSKLSSEKMNIFDERALPVSHELGAAYIGGNSMVYRLKKVLQMMNSVSRKNSSPESNRSNSAMRKMPTAEAEALVKKWQATKAEALGPNYQLHPLGDILDDSMLDQWLALAGEAKARSCHWRFVLLQLSVLRADIFTDKYGAEVAEIDAVIEEAAELVDDSLPKAPNYYSSYKVQYALKKQDDASWRFCKGDIRTAP